MSGSSKVGSLPPTFIPPLKTFDKEVEGSIGLGLRLELEPPPRPKTQTLNSKAWAPQGA